MTSEVAFYVLRDESDETYMVSSRSLEFSEDINDTRAHFETEKSALDGIKDLRKRGMDVSSLVIVPVKMVAGKAIKPKLMEQKEGYVLEITYLRYDGKEVVTYYKGNKAKSLTVKPDSTYGWWPILGHGVKQTVTATIFNSSEKAQKRLDEILNVIDINKKNIKARLKDDYLYDGERSNLERDVADFDNYTLNIVKVAA